MSKATSTSTSSALIGMVHRFADVSFRGRDKHPAQDLQYGEVAGVLQVVEHQYQFTGSLYSSLNEADDPVFQGQFMSLAS
jgi:hypothetical protein